LNAETPQVSYVKVSGVDGKWIVVFVSSLVAAAAGGGDIAPPDATLAALPAAEGPKHYRGMSVRSLAALVRGDHLNFSRSDGCETGRKMCRRR